MTKLIVNQLFRVFLRIDYMQSIFVILKYILYNQYTLLDKNWERVSCLICVGQSNPPYNMATFNGNNVAICWLFLIYQIQISLKWLRFVTRLSWRVPLVEQELLNVTVHMSSPRLFVLLVLCVCFIDRCLSFYILPLWYLQTLYIYECCKFCIISRTSQVMEKSCSCTLISNSGLWLPVKSRHFLMVGIISYFTCGNIQLPRWCSGYHVGVECGKSWIQSQTGLVK